MQHSRLVSANRYGLALLLMALMALANAASAAEVLPEDRNRQVTPPDSTRAMPPDQDSEMYDPRTGTFKRGSERDTDSTRPSTPDPYDKSIQPTDIPTSPGRQQR